MEVRELGLGAVGECLAEGETDLGLRQVPAVDARAVIGIREDGLSGLSGVHRGTCESWLLSFYFLLYTIYLYAINKLDLKMLRRRTKVSLTFLAIDDAPVSDKTLLQCSANSCAVRWNFSSLDLGTTW